jgi:hypothetical protein
MRSPSPAGGAEGVLPHVVRGSQPASLLARFGWPIAAGWTPVATVVAVGAKALPHEVEDVVTHHGGSRILGPLKVVAPSDRAKFQKQHV